MLSQTIIAENSAAGDALTELKFQRPAMALGTFSTAPYTDELVRVAALC